MIYKQFKDVSISTLGLGCMRLPTIDGVYKNIDEVETAKMVKVALDSGINYFDTAYGYHEGNSERVMGKILANYPRNTYFLASKFPGFSKNNFERKEEIFEEQLNKCKTSYFDFYLLHCVDDSNIEMYLDEKYGVVEYLLKMKKLGKIKYLGFSTHASNENFKRFLDKFYKNMEFCQVQFNYADVSYQKAIEKYEILNELHIPMWVMEPLRGGKLAKLPSYLDSKLHHIKEDESSISMAFRYLQSFDNINVILSGMSNMDQLLDNIKIFNEYKPLNDVEKDKLEKIGTELMSKKTLPCTNCKYCVSKCPMHLSIPELIKIFNDELYSSNDKIDKKAFDSYQIDVFPTSCIDCKSCEEVCPQKISISNMMKEFSKKMK